MNTKGKIFQNHHSKKFYKVYRITHNTDGSKVFVHYFQVRSFADDTQYGAEKYHTENLQDFLNEHRTSEQPPPFPKKL